MTKHINQDLTDISKYNPQAFIGECEEITVCRACHSTKLNTFLSLGLMPKPNGFLRKEDLKKPEPYYPLDVDFCEQCGQVQLKQVVKPSEMFDHYVYASAASTPMVTHLDEMADSIVKRFKLNSKTLAIDIGSNDGTLLSFFKKRGTQILGIDPAQNIVAEANKAGLTTMLAFFGEAAARKAKEQYGQADVITAANVIAHIPDWDSVFSGARILLKETGTFIIEFPYLVDMLDKMEFDTIYHEHLTMMAVSPLSVALERNGLKLVDVEHFTIHGGSLRVFIQKREVAQPKNSVADYIAQEKAHGITEEKTYIDFANKVYAFHDELIELVSKLTSEGKEVIAYGASAKGNIILNFCNLHSGLIHQMVDSTTYKQGLYTPGTHIPVITEKELEKRKADYALLTAWNFADAILKKNEANRQQGLKFIVPIPELTIV